MRDVISRRHIRIARSALLVLLAGALVLPAAGAFLSPEPASAAPTAAELASQVKALDAELAAAGKEYDAAYWRLHETQVRIGRLGESIAQTQAELDARESALGARAVAWYKRGDEGPLEFILGSTSFSELTTRLELMERLATSDAELIREYKDLRVAYEAEQEALEREQERQSSDVAALEAKKSALEREFSAKKAEYDELQAALKAAMERERRQNAVTYEPPVGANGMVFPVQGPNYYSDTWGASRSGGRRSHKGTDIMAANGTPVVAVLSGTVSSKEGGLGGKVIYLKADNGWTFYYAHLSGWAVRSGRVSAGQLIGYVGSTGNASASAPHLHFEIHPSGSAVNPYSYLRRMQ